MDGGVVCPPTGLGVMEASYKQCERWAARSAQPGKLILTRWEWDSCPSAHKGCFCRLASLPCRRGYAPHKVFPRTAEVGGGGGVQNARQPPSGGRGLTGTLAPPTPVPRGLAGAVGGPTANWDPLHQNPVETSRPLPHPLPVQGPGPDPRNGPSSYLYAACHEQRFAPFPLTDCYMPSIIHPLHPSTPGYGSPSDPTQCCP